MVKTLMLTAALAASMVLTTAADTMTPKAIYSPPLEAPEVVEIAPEEETAAETEPAEETPHLVSLGTFTVTAYCTCVKCSGKWGDWTASGTHTVEGRTVAVDPKVIPLGTHIWIDGHEYIAEDTGSGVKGKWVDIFLDSHSRAAAYGVQKKTVYVMQQS